MTASRATITRAGRILVAGTSGSGKSTLAREIAARAGLPYHEIDALHWGDGWAQRPTFLDDVTALAASPAWVTEWQYGTVRPLLAARAELVVWVDPPVAVVLARVTRRTVVRRVRREPLWADGIVEQPLHTLFTDRDHIIRWAWRTRRQTAKRLHALARATGPEVVRIRASRDREALLRLIERSTARDPR